MNLKSFFSPWSAPPAAQPVCVAGHALDPHWGGVCPYCEAIDRGRRRTASVRDDPDATVVDRDATVVDGTTRIAAAPPATGREARVVEPVDDVAGDDARADSRPVTGVLVALGGPAAGRLFAVREGRNTIGRGGATRRCDIEVRHDGAMAAEQALILGRGARHELIELGGGGTTVVDGAPVGARVVELTDHCTVGVGTTVLEFLRVEGGRSVAAPDRPAADASRDDPDRTVTG